MNFKGKVTSVLFCLALTGCVTGERVKFEPGLNQMRMVRDGVPAISSKSSRSLAILKPALREFRDGQRVIFTLAVNNLTSAPTDLRISNIMANQITTSGSEVALEVITYEQLLQEERTRQVFAAVAVGLSATANAYSASRAGYGTYSGTAYGSRGSVTYSGNYYSPTAAAIASTNASIKNQAMINSTMAQGRQNLNRLERLVLKDTTVMPREWIGGRVFLAPPIGADGKPKSYEIKVRFAGDVHTFKVSQFGQK